MLSAKSIYGKRVLVCYRLENIRMKGKRLREPRKQILFRVMPRTVELNKWLAWRGWDVVHRKHPNRAIDFYVRRFWWLWITPKKWPDKRWSTLMIIDKMVEMVKQGDLPYFQSLDLVENPNRGRLLDYLSYYFYLYENGKKKGYK